MVLPFLDGETEKKSSHNRKSFMAQFVHKAFLLINKKQIQMNIKPLSDRVLVEPANAETKTASGIIIPDTAQEKPQKGTIVAVGNGKIDEPLTVKVGDTVLYGKYSGTELKLEGKDYMIMRESDILAIL